MIGKPQVQQAPSPVPENNQHASVSCLFELKTRIIGEGNGEREAPREVYHLRRKHTAVSFVFIPQYVSR